MHVRRRILYITHIYIHTKKKRKKKRKEKRKENKTKERRKGIQEKMGQ